MKQEVASMTNKQTLGLLEALKIIVEQMEREDVIKAIERIQAKLKEPTITE